MFEIAYFFHIDPAVVLALPRSRFELYEAQAVRLSERMNNQS